MIVNINGTCYELIKEYEIYNAPPTKIEVQTYQEMIDYEYRYVGLTCYVSDENRTYKFNENFEWEELMAYFTVDLMDAWELSTTIPNPDELLYEGVYQSFKNKGIASQNAVMKITFTGYTEFNVYIRSWAESNYDYTIASTLDAASYPNSYTDSTAFANTRGKQQSSTTLSAYTKVSYATDGAEHFIYIVYRKDSSADNGDDRGYVLIQKQ